MRFDTAYYIRHADRRVHAQAGLAINADDFVGRVRQELSQALSGGEATLEMVARRLGLSPASLYRRLRERDAAFTHLLHEVRYDLAVGHVRERRLSLTEVALVLGYSELSAFSRAFRRWTGMSPARYRSSHRDPAAPRAPLAGSQVPMPREGIHDE